jgi:hypothetical protein
VDLRAQLRVCGPLVKGAALWKAIAPAQGRLFVVGRLSGLFAPVMFMLAGLMATIMPIAP